MPARFANAAFAACLFLLILGAKWATFDRYGSPMPDWDQWDAEGFELLIPWFGPDPFLPHLVHPHNEHRVVVTKLQNLALALLNGQWDARVEAVCNAALHSSLAAAFFLLGCRGCAPRWLPPLFVVLFALFGPPLAWQNVLGGFHSQQYWLLGLSFAAILLLPFAPPRTAAWWLGAFAVVAALGTMGSGFLAAAVVLVVLAWRLLLRTCSLRSAAPALLLCLAVVATGLLTRVEVAWHAQMKAASVSDFVLSLLHSLQWPLRGHYWGAALFWLPWGGLAWRVFSRRGSAFDQALLALGGWVLVQLVATAYARGAGGDYPASRYMDTLSFGAAVNALALARLLPLAASAPSAVRWSASAFALGWCLALGAGVHRLAREAIDIELPGARRYYTAAESNLRSYLVTGNPRHLAGPDIPYPNLDALVDALGRPAVRALMPAPLRPPLPLLPVASAGFHANHAVDADPVDPPRLGLSPATPPLDYTRTWGTHPPPVAPLDAAPASAEFRSAPLRPTLTGGWLKFETAGHPGHPGLTLEIRAAATDALLAPIIPDRTPGDTFRAAYVRQPAVPFVVVARDTAPDRWLAFSGPVEVGPLSYFAWQAAKHGLLLAQVALGLTAALFVATLRLRRRPTAP